MQSVDEDAYKVDSALLSYRNGSRAVQNQECRQGRQVPGSEEGLGMDIEMWYDVIDDLLCG